MHSDGGGEVGVRTRVDLGHVSGREVNVHGSVELKDEGMADLPEAIKQLSRAKVVVKVHEGALG